MNKQIKVEYIKEFIDESLHSCIIDNHNQIETWFRRQWIKYPPPFYSSIDIRNSGFKIAPIDTNLFPAGFNNLNKDFEFLYIAAIQHILERVSENISKILIIPENHTRNKFYLKSLDTLVDLIKKSGYEVRVARIQSEQALELKSENIIRKNDYLLLGDYNPDVIILNNDLSDGVPALLNGIKQPILPDKNMGWSNRSKTIHFDYYSDIVNSFSRILNIDGWLLEPQFRNCGEIDFQTKQGEDCLLYNANKLFNLIQKKYDEYSINEKPYIMIKADSGTYGMGIMRVDNLEMLKNLNRKQRIKMSKIKGGNKLDRVILQEGIYSYEHLKLSDHVAEPVIYSFGSNLVGGFYRLHNMKNNSENLNAPGMIFHPIPFENACLTPNTDEAIYSETNKFYIYGVVARLAILAAAKEIYNLGD